MIYEFILNVGYNDDFERQKIIHVFSQQILKKIKLIFEPAVFKILL